MVSHVVPLQFGVISGDIRIRDGPPQLEQVLGDRLRGLGVLGRDHEVSADVFGLLNTPANQTMGVEYHWRHLQSVQPMVQPC